MKSLFPYYSIASHNARQDSLKTMFDTSRGVKTPVGAFKTLKWLLIILVLGLMFWASGVFAQLTDDFETYNTGDLRPQSNWNTAPSGECGYGWPNVVSTTSYHGVKSVEFKDKYPFGSSCYIYDITTIASSTWNGTQVFYIKSEDTSYAYDYGGIQTETGGISLVTQFGIRNGTGVGQGEACYLGAGSIYTCFATFPLDDNVWYAFEIAWRDDGKVKFQVATATSTEIGVWEVSSGWVAPYQSFASQGISGASIYEFQWKSVDTRVWFDLFDETPYSPSEEEKELRVWGINPECGTEINATNTEITIGYEGFNADIYEALEISFYEQTTGLLAIPQIYTADELATSGQKVIAFEDLGIDRNSYWHLFGIGFMSFWPFPAFTENIADDCYYDVNIEGYIEVFVMEDPETWYAENTPYATATGFFLTITDFLFPFFSKVGEFGSRIDEYFDDYDAFVRGYAVGSYIPLLNLYFNELNFLFGGFPLIQFFLIGNVLLLGFFLLKLLLKVVRG